MKAAEEIPSSQLPISYLSATLKATNPNQTKATSPNISYPNQKKATIPNFSYPIKATNPNFSSLNRAMAQKFWNPGCATLEPSDRKSAHAITHAFAHV